MIDLLSYRVLTYLPATLTNQVNMTSALPSSPVIPRSASSTELTLLREENALLRERMQRQDARMEELMQRISTLAASPRTIVATPPPPSDADRILQVLGIAVNIFSFGSTAIGLLKMIPAPNVTITSTPHVFSDTIDLATEIGRSNFVRAMIDIAGSVD